MKKLALVTALAFVSAWGSASAADTQNVAVTATIQSICKFSGSATAVVFGSIDPNAAAGELSQPLTIPYKCTKGITPLITTGILTPLTNVAGDTMAFTVDTISTSAATGFTAAVNGTSNVRIASTVWQNAPAGAYTGNIVLNINN